VESVRSLATINKEDFRKALVDLAKNYTAQADLEFDEHGKVIRKKGNDLGLQDTIVVDRTTDDPATPTALFDAGNAKRKSKRRARQCSMQV